MVTPAARREAVTILVETYEMSGLSDQKSPCDFRENGRAR